MNKEITTGIEIITPEMAREYLKTNTFNRPVSKDTVSLYASAMRRGQWELNGESIIFSRDGRMLNGQHRMLAIIEANVSIKTLVVRGIKTSAFDTIDQGKTRSSADVLSMQGVNSATIVGSIISQYMIFKAGWGAGEGGKLKQLKITKRDILEEYKIRPSFWDDLVREAQRYYRKKRILTKKDIGSNYAFLYLQKKHREEVIRNFYDQLFGIEEVQNNTILLLRDKIIDASLKGYKIEKSYQQALLIKAFNAYIIGKEYKVLSFNINKEEYPSYI